MCFFFKEANHCDISGIALYAFGIVLLKKPNPVNQEFTQPGGQQRGGLGVIPSSPPTWAHCSWLKPENKLKRRQEAGFRRCWRNGIHLLGCQLSWWAWNYSYVYETWCNHGAFRKMVVGNQPQVPEAAISSKTGLFALLGSASLNKAEGLMKTE